MRAKLQALLGPLAKPRINITVGPDGQPIEETDPRHHGQRMHDALEDVCDRLLRSENPVPDSGGTPATVIVTIDVDDLLAKTGYAVTSDGTLIRADTVRELTDRPRSTPRSSPDMARCCGWAGPGGSPAAAKPSPLHARDGGCSFPGCDISPEWCERHHVIGWIEGGTTDLDNLTLLCRYHHHNFAGKGWDCRDQRRRTPRMATTLVDRPNPHPADQHPHPGRTCGTTAPTAVSATMAIHHAFTITSVVSAISSSAQPWVDVDLGPGTGARRPLAGEHGADLSRPTVAATSGRGSTAPLAYASMVPSSPAEAPTGCRRR